ncbi:hypothetical protein L9F63_001942, partial [Diploptera punctata]
PLSRTTVVSSIASSQNFIVSLYFVHINANKESVYFSVRDEHMTLSPVKLELRPFIFKKYAIGTSLQLNCKQAESNISILNCSY